MFSDPKINPLEEACRLLAQATWVLDDEVPELREEVEEFLLAHGRCLDCGSLIEAEEERPRDSRPLVVIISI